ncbi:carbon monoxide dehydrogenase subunit G [Actinomadura sp. B10D3]|uniref:SRPBCC family protein n=1 Tax=Actinomadura sp. B10D3 TaxID=3153557 RepID=UPI00325D5FA8
MQLTGSASVAAPLDRVWDALQDPAVLARTIPGCSSLEETAPDTYRMTVTAGVASIKGTYVGRVELAEPDPPRSFVLRARGQGAPGTVDATVRVRLSGGDGATRIDYDADAVVGGMVGGVGQRMLGSVAKRTAGEFFAAVERDLTAPAPAPAAAPPDAAPEQAGPVYPGRAAAAPDRTAGTAWPMAAAFVSGGAVALAGVAVGYLLGRQGR